MDSKRRTKIQQKFISILAVLFLFALVFAGRKAEGASLSELVSRAKQEGALNASVTSSMSGRVTPKLAAAFNKRFGLNLSVTFTAIADTENFPRAIVETKVGTVPAYDAIEGSEINQMNLQGVGGLQLVDNWQSLLAEINPLVRDKKVRPEEISSIPLAGYSFEYLSRVKSILYNPRLISLAGLPKTHAELSDPKYRGKWIQPPWTSHWDIGPFVFPELGKEKWLEVIRNAGKNAGAVGTEQQGVERVLLGEFAFALANTYYAFDAKARDAKAPIEITYFKDYNQANGAYYGVRKGARHPAAGTLFSLWMVTPDAESVWQPDLAASQYKWGESDLDKMERQLIREVGANIVELVKTKEGRDFLAWYGTDEGRKYRQGIGKAIRGE